MVRELLANERVLSGRRRVDRDFPAGRARRREDARNRRRLGPDEERGRSGAAGAEHLRREIRRGSRDGQLGRHRIRVLRERLVERLRALLPVRGVVRDQRDLQLLRDQVLGEAEGHAVVGRRDAKDVRPLGRVDEALAALVGDCERDVLVARDLPGGVDAGAFVDDRDRAVGDRLADVADRGARGEARVVALDPEAVLDAVDLDAGLRSGELGAVGDRLPDVRRPRERRVDRDRHGLGLGRVRALVVAAAGEDRTKRDDEKESPHESFCRPR